jgi:RNA polymerase sigma factor (sigma-70 family)
MPDRDQALIFAEASPMLLGLAYRILGSRADAEDAVQDTFLKWQHADKASIENPAAWLTTICTRRCIDLLRAAHRTRVDYVGAWLPEPIHTATDEGPEDKLSLASSLSTAFLLLLERLTAKERAAYLLHEIFDIDYPQIARTLDIQEATVRKLVSRARTNVEQAKVRHITPVDRQEQLLAAFEAAIADGGTDRLAALLSDDVQLSADSGGKVPTILQVLQGKADVLDFVRQALRQYWGSYRWIAADINGGRGVIIKHDDETVASMSFAFDELGRATNIYIMRNPDKLARLEATAIH